MKVNLNKWYRCKIDDQIYKELLKKSDWQRTKHILIFFTSLLISKKNLWEAYKEIILAIIKQVKNPNYKIDVQLPNNELR